MDYSDCWLIVPFAFIFSKFARISALLASTSPNNFFLFSIILSFSRCSCVARCASDYIFSLSLCLLNSFIFWIRFTVSCLSYRFISLSNLRFSRSFSSRYLALVSFFSFSYCFFSRVFTRNYSWVTYRSTTAYLSISFSRLSLFCSSLSASFSVASSYWRIAYY